MKYIVLIGDGMADFPIKELDNRTILEVADIPNMTEIVKMGTIGRINTIPDGFSPASDVANLTILGYDPAKYYCGRGPLEAANMGIELKENEVAFRCNLITVEGESLVDYSAGHISSQEASELIALLNEQLSNNEFVKFYPGLSYRHLLVIKGPDTEELAKVKCTPPHDVIGQNILKNLPQGKTSNFLIDLMERSREILSLHEINRVRIDLKENPANMIWPWGQGKAPSMPSFEEKYKISGSMISAVDLMNGLGRLIGLKVIKVPGATGYYDTNYEGKAQHAIDSLKKRDFVFVHVEAPDEAGHNGDILAKKAAIENFDKFIVKKALVYLKDNPDTRILIMPDHATPVEVRTHTRDLVFFAMCGKGIEHGGFSMFNESEALKSNRTINNGYELMDDFIRA